ncbi:MAG: DNA polymerase III subunit gamma/tau [Gemmatimonadetes bacterium]|nr:DNA polymerase III subunit gamma/tau [Gemmatimonadota bacterium]
MSVALARKYRPKSFASVAVQSHVSLTLRGAIARGRVAHGYLLCGPRGTGKTTLARVLAMALNCERRVAGDTGPAAGEPCGRCTSCTRIWAGSASLDVVEIDAASNRGVDDARELRERALYAPSGDDRWKVYIVDEAHMLTKEAWNALLKVLEEPPPRVVFVFCTTEPQKIAQSAAPILSRLQRFDLRRIGPHEIRDRLAHVLHEEGVAFDEDALGLIARAADGGLRDALSLTDQVLSLGSEGGLTSARVREALGLVPEDEYLAVLDLVIERRAGDVFGTVAHLADAGIDFQLFLAGFADLLRGQLAVALGGGDVPGISERVRAALDERKGRLAPADLLRMLNLVLEIDPYFRRSSQQQLLLETLLVRCALLDRAIALEDVLRGLPVGARDAGAGRGASGPAAPASGGPSGTGRATVARRGAPVAEDSATRHAAPAAERSPSRQPASATPVAMPTAAPVAMPTSAPAVATDGTAPAMRATVAPRAAMRAGPVAPARADIEVSAAPPVLADAPPRRDADLLPDPALLAQEWDAIVAGVRARGRGMLATILEGAIPVAVATTGAVTLEVDDPLAHEGLDRGAADVVAALTERWPGVTRLTVRRASGRSPAPAQRITAESAKADRVSALRKRDPVLGAAIDALDLEPLD